MLNISQTAVRPLDRHCALILQSYIHFVIVLFKCSPFTKSASHLPATVQLSIRMEREADLTDGAWWCQTCWSSLLTQPSEISLSVICDNVSWIKKVLLMEPFTPTAYCHRMNYILVLFFCFFRPSLIFLLGGVGWTENPHFFFFLFKNIRTTSSPFFFFLGPTFSEFLSVFIVFIVVHFLFYFVWRYLNWFQLFLVPHLFPLLHSFQISVLCSSRFNDIEQLWPFLKYLSNKSGIHASAPKHHTESTSATVSLFYACQDFKGH